MNGKKIKELFELCLRVSNETAAHVNFDYSADGDMSVVYIYIFNNSREIIKHFTLCQFYNFESEAQDYEDAKKCLLELLINGRCPLNES
nr:MAG TPA: hypothetical protein [Caudoviricetes sp.]